MTAFFILMLAHLSLSTRPLQAAAPGQDRRWTEVSAGDTQVCALDEAGVAVCWGPSLPAGGQTVAGPRFTTLAVGLALDCAAADCAAGPPVHACGLDRDGLAWCWGDNRFGQLGDGTTTARATPAAVAGGPRFRTIRAGRAFTCGMAETTAWCWGFNGKANLGLGTTSGPHLRPQTVANHALAVEAGRDFACALNGDGHAYCWGEDYHGRLGSDAAATAGPTSAPVPVNGAARFSALSARGNHVCALTPLGQVWCWGSNVDGQLGGGSPGPVARRDPTDSRAPPLSSITVGAGGHSCGLAADGAAWCWGRNAHGELGVRAAGSVSCFADPCVPSPARAAPDHRFRSLSAGLNFTCGVTQAGALLCWGRLPWNGMEATSPVLLRASGPGQRAAALQRPPSLSGPAGPAAPPSGRT